MDLETFILIGGRSKRFGSDKAFFEFEGETLAARAARTIAATFPNIRTSFIAASDGQFGDKASSLSEHAIFDRRPGLGAWSGLHAAVAASATEWTLVLACDLPFVTPELLQRLDGERSDDLDAVVTRQSDGRLQPLCAVYRTEATRLRVESLLDAGSPLPPLTSLFEQLHTEIVDVGGDDLRNVNTRADLA